MVRSEGDMSLKNPVTPPGIDPGTARLVAQRLVLVGTQYETYFTRQFWCLEFGGGSHIFGKMLGPWWDEW